MNLLNPIKSCWPIFCLKFIPTLVMVKRQLSATNAQLNQLGFWSFNVEVWVKVRDNFYSLIVLSTRNEMCPKQCLLTLVWPGWAKGTLGLVLHLMNIISLHFPLPSRAFSFFFNPFSAPFFPSVHPCCQKSSSIFSLKWVETKTTTVFFLVDFFQTLYSGENRRWWVVISKFWASVPP